MNMASDMATAAALQICAEHQAEVLNIRHEVIWPDGSRVLLHPVRQAGSNAQLLRGIHHAGNWFLLDLKAIIPRDEHDVRVAPVRDQVGLVMYALRHRFHNAEAFLAKADRQHLAKWTGDARPAGTRPTRTGRVAAAAEA